MATVSLTQQPAAAADRGGCGPVRPSRRARWRALSLVLVHVAAAAHIVHWKVAGTTLTPVEPSEAMQTLGQQALLNAGFVLFALLILSTFVLGRFFCGWGCHLVALQDLCTWLLRKLGMQPRPFRSRLLVFVPLLAFVYMFILPTLVRIWLGEPRAPLQAHFLTDDFWERFPAWPIALLTFAVCGFLIVYLLGNKGFCTYGCPYGGIFGVADAVAPGRIRVTDACEGCGHCTATCTSNVRVHEEVRTWGMVVDPGCMKCMDCVSVCPKDALRFGFGRPAVRRGSPRAAPARRRYDFTWPEEIALAVLFAASIVVLRGLYDRVPFLLALGLAAMSAAALLAVGRMRSVPDLRFGRFQLRRGGRVTRAGVVFAAVVALWTVFLVHSAVVKHEAYQAGRALAAARPAPDADADEAALRRAVDRLERARRLALVPMGRLEAGLAEAHETLGDADRAAQHYERAVELEPRYAEGRVRLARLLAARGEPEAAVAQLREAVRLRPDLPDARGDLADLLVALGRPREAADALRSVLARRPDDAAARLSYGVVLAHAGDIDASVAEIRRVVELEPANAEAHLKLGQILANQRRFEEALEAFRRTADLEPTYLPAHYLAAQVAIRLERHDVALSHLDTARRLDPFHAAVAQAWAEQLAKTGGLAAAIAAAETAGPADRAARFALVHLYRAGGRADDAARLEATLEGGTP
ncbi:MAG: tetratricopeptide repeat protein [Planctomycetota bacterium]